MKDLERYVERIVTSQTTQEAFDHFCAAMRERGYDRIAYSLVNDHPSLGLLSQHGLATSYPEDWMKHYAKHNFSLDRSGDAAGIDEAYAVLLVRLNVQA